MQVTLKHKAETKDQALVITLYAPPLRDLSKRDLVSVNIFASVSNEQLIVPGQELLLTLLETQRVAYIKLSEQFSS